MALWVTLVVIAQFLNAVVAMIDKYVLSSATIPKPAGYAFYITILSALSVFVFFFSWIPIPIDTIAIPSFQNVEALTFTVAWVSLVAGAALFGALVTLFYAFKRADASDVVPVAGAFSAIGALGFSSLFLGTTLSGDFFLGFLLLVAGTLFLSLYRFGVRVLALSVSSGLLFAAHFVCIKALFEQTGFDNAFFWTRMGIVAVALLALLIPYIRRCLKIRKGKTRRRAGLLIISNKVLAGLGSLMLLKAIELGDVSVVQALGGLQFAFLLAFASVFKQGMTEVCGERCERQDMKQKWAAVVVIIIGFAVLFL